MNKHVISDPNGWVDQHGDYLYRYAMTRVRDPELAEELVQETYLAALKAKEGFNGQSSERTWYVGIMKHKIIDHYRRSVRERPLTDIETDDERGIDQFFTEASNLAHWVTKPRTWAPSPSSPEEQKELWAVFEQCLEGLPPRTAAAFTMRELDDSSGDEICKALGISSANFWVMLHRARLKLRQCLEANWFCADLRARAAAAAGDISDSENPNAHDKPARKKNGSASTS